MNWLTIKEKEIAKINPNNPLFNKPIEKEIAINELDNFFSDTPTSSDFLNSDSSEYIKKIEHIQKNDKSIITSNNSNQAIIEKLTESRSTPNQQKIERSLLERGASQEEIEEYLKYKNAPREKILAPKRVLSAFFDLNQEDEPILEDFLLMAHRNNIGYAFTVPTAEGSNRSVYHLEPPTD